jgi:CheY-like chemotaxis protein
VPTDKLHILLADDDEDDCLFFSDALKDLGLPATLTTVDDGAQLMQYLLKKGQLFPDVLYLDLNMPRKTGYECLAEIKGNVSLRTIPVVIYSTSLDKKTAELLYEQGADYYLRKPSAFSDIKIAITRSIELITKLKNGSRSKEDFIIGSG